MAPITPSIRRRARAIAVLLLLLWIGPVTFAQTDSSHLLGLGAPGSAQAESSVIPAGMAMVLEPNTQLELRLHDGTVLEGRFLGRVLVDSAAYAPRFAARARASSPVPIAMDETLHVSLRDGREYTAPFTGYGEMALVLRSPHGPDPLRVPFESALQITRSIGERIEPSNLAQAFRAGLLPSAEALEIVGRVSGADPWGSRFRVPVEDIESATLTGAPAASAPATNGGDVLFGVVLLSVVLSTIVVFAIIGASIHSASSSCGSTGPSINPGSFLGAHLTKRPFDRSRGCFVGDPLAMADSWPAPTVSLADDAMSGSR